MLRFEGRCGLTESGQYSPLVPDQKVGSGRPLEERTRRSVHRHAALGAADRGVVEHDAGALPRGGRHGRGARRALDTHAAQYL